MMHGPTLFAALVLAAPVAAQDAAEALAKVRACSAADCIGAFASACQEATPSGDTTLGIAACLMAEAEAWDRRLNEIWADLIASARARDAAEPDAEQEALLRAAQQAWIAFRDADCAQEHGHWGTGSMRQIAGAACQLQRTATRALELDAKREASGGGL